MKNILLLVASLMPAVLAAQSVLEKLAVQMQALKSASLDFEYTYENDRDNTRDVQRGSLLMAGSMYRLDRGQSVIYCNGTTRWTYLKDANEVTISQANVIEDGVFANPSLLFSFDDKDYVCKPRSDRREDGRTLLEVDLFPKDAKADYTNINLRLDKASLMPVRVAYYSKGGGSVTIRVDRVETAPKTAPSDFSFDAKKFPDVEVVDMR